MLEVITGEASKYYKKKNQRRNDETMDKYALLKRFHYDDRFQVYMYNFMYVDPGTIPVEDYFPDTFFSKPQENVNFWANTKTLAWIQLHIFRRL